MSRVHDLKVWPEFFEPLSNGDKTFEVRRDDRGFSVGDTLRLREWDGVDGYSDREIVRAVTYILAGPLFGVEPGIVIMALAAPVAGGLERLLEAVRAYGDARADVAYGRATRKAIDLAWDQLLAAGGIPPLGVRAALADTERDGLDAAWARRWHLGSMNDGLFIIDRKPSGSGTDVPPGVYASDPELVLNAVALTEEQAQAICDAHNAALAASQPVAEEG